MNPDHIAIAIGCIFAYLIGSISFAIVSAKLFKLADPRHFGSKNPGATNILRTGNKLAALLTLIGDALKGFVVVMLARWYFVLDELSTTLIALAVFLGHQYPIFLKFKGGKGVATTAGILFALNWMLGLFAMGTWLVSALVFRYSSLAALIAALSAPLFTLYNIAETERYTILVCLLSVMLIIKHKENIKRLAQGKETKIRSVSNK